MRLKITSFLILLIMLCGCAYLSYFKDPFVDIPAFSKVNDNMYRGGYPNQQGYRKLQKLGIKTIINLSGVNKRLEMEQQTASQLGFTIVHIPLSIYKWPEDEKVLTFLKTTLTPQTWPIFIHCTNGRDRTGAMIATYRVIVENKGPKEGYREALEHGFWPYRGEVVLKKYIHQLKDRKVLYDFVKTYQQRLLNEGKQ